MSQIIKPLTASGPIPPNIPTSFVANDGTTSTPAANIENIVGNNTANNGFATWTTASGNTHLINSYGTAKWVVNPIPGVGTHTTIASAIASATSGETIFLTPATYIEDLVLKPGVDLVTFSGEDSLNGSGSVVILGNCSLTTAGTVNISNIQLQTNGASFLSVTGSSASLVNLESCFLNITAAVPGIIFSSSSSSSQINIRDASCNITVAGGSYFAHSSAGSMVIDYSRFSNSGLSTTSSTISSGSIFAYATRFLSPLSSSGSAAVGIYYCRLTAGVAFTPLTLGSSGENIVDHCYFDAVASTCISISTLATLIECTLKSSNASVIAGAGTVQFGGLIFSGSSSAITTTTQTALVRSNDAVVVVRPSAYPYTVKTQDEVISVDTSGAAPTVTLPASPVNGQKHTVKDRSANASASNITVSGNGHNIVGTTSAATQTISLNGASVTYVYDTSVWLAT